MREGKHDVAGQLKELSRLSAAGLRARWRTVFGRPAPGSLQRDFLVRALAYRVQEEAYGGNNAIVRRQLLRYAAQIELTGQVVSLNRIRIKPGTRLVRAWRNETHVVTALERGFEYCGKRYDSLSEIARAITGTRWSGPAFFGLKGPHASSNSARGHDSGPRT